MEMSPHHIRTASFATSRKGFDPKEVEAFLESVAAALEAAQNQSTAMEAKARAAIARLQELAAGGPSASPTAVQPAPDSSAAVTTPPASVSAEQADQISRTLLLAQRAADDAVAEARREAERILESARGEAAGTIETTRERAAALIEEARADARSAESDERERARSEVEALLARREFLTSDVDHLEKFLVDQRERLRLAAAALVDVAERVPGGLGHVRAPLMSAAEHDLDGGSPAADGPHPDADTGEGADPDPDPDADTGTGEGSDTAPDTGTGASAGDAERAGDGPAETTRPMPVIRTLDADDPTPSIGTRGPAGSVDGVDR